jgi:RNA polymerase sigma factor (sigma-70 family)
LGHVRVSPLTRFVVLHPLRIEQPGKEARARDALVDELYAHGPVLLAAARVITLDDDEAQDLVQTTFEIALRHLDGLRDPRALRAWLLRVQTREAFRVVRRLRRLVRLDGQVREVPTAGSDAAQRIDVQDGLARLPRRIRAAIALHYLAGMSVPETARALGVSENTVKSQLKTGLARLREDLHDD